MFRQPCLAMSAGTDADALLAAAFQPYVAPSIPLPERTGSCGPQRVHGWQTRGPGPSTLRPTSRIPPAQAEGRF